MLLMIDNYDSFTYNLVQMIGIYDNNKPMVKRNDDINIDDIKSKITSKTKAIMIVHIYGLTVDIDPIIKVAKEYNLKIIEDHLPE